MTALVRRRITDRNGGSSEPPFDAFNLSVDVGDRPTAVAANRARLAAALDLPVDRLVWMQQVHGTAVAAVTGPHREPVPGTDALVTDVPGLALAVLVADCVPVLASDPDAGVVGAAHAGRRGAAGGVLRSLVTAMAGLGARPERLRVELGPAICGRCYEVPPALQEQVERDLPGSACRTGAGTAGLDLRAGLAAQCGVLGIADIAVDPRCTREDSGLFSHRRGHPTGRQAALIWLA